MKMLTCKDASRLISQRMERRLTFRERWGLRLHLMICRNCRRFERQMVLLRRALRELGRRAETGGADITQPGAFTPEVRERIRQALAERGGP